MNLREVITIHEVIPHVSVAGTTREIIFPLDILVIEGVVYHIIQMTNNDGIISFVASVNIKDSGDE